MRIKLLKKWFFASLTVALLTACSSSMFSKQVLSNRNEQFYIDARLNFAIKHPLDWELQQIPTSSPEYRADTVHWSITLPQPDPGAAEMLILAHQGQESGELSALLDTFLAELPTLDSQPVEAFKHSAGSAIKLIGQNNNLTWLIVAVDGRQRDFIISFTCPVDNYQKLKPLFEDIVDSFVEISHPSTPS